jgi:hypothetical protein
MLHALLKGEQKKVQIGIHRFGSSAAAASLRGRLSEGRWRRKGEKRWGAGEDRQHHHNRKPEQYGVRHAEWKLLHHCWQAAEQPHGQKAEGGKVTCRPGIET